MAGKAKIIYYNIWQGEFSGPVCVVSHRKPMVTCSQVFPPLGTSLMYLPREPLIGVLPWKKSLNFIRCPWIQLIVEEWLNVFKSPWKAVELSPTFIGHNKVEGYVQIGGFYRSIIFQPATNRCIYMYNFHDFGDVTRGPYTQLIYPGVVFSVVDSPFC